MAGRRDETSTLIHDWIAAAQGRVWIGGHNVRARKVLEEKLAHAERPPEGPIDAAFITPQTADEANYFARKLRLRLQPNAVVWIVYPKSGPANAAEFSGDIEEVVLELFQAGFMEAGRGPIDDTYDSIGFRSGGNVFEAPSFV